MDVPLFKPLIQFNVRERLAWIFPPRSYAILLCADAGETLRIKDRIINNRLVRATCDDLFASFALAFIFFGFTSFHLFSRLRREQSRNTR